MGRKTGKDVLIEVEVGTNYYPMAALSTVSSPASEVGKKFETSAEFLSAQEDLEPVVRLDGVVSGLTLSPGSGYNEVDYSDGSLCIKGNTVNVSAGTVTDLLRPTVTGQVRVTALTVNESGTVNKTAGVAGATSTTRGGAGGPPFLPVDEVLIGYITMSYYGGSASGASTIAASEINDETRERATIPSYEVMYHDGSGDNPTNVGAIRFATALPLIHAATAAGPGTDRRNVYCAYYAAEFEQVPDARDFSFDEDVATVRSRAYLDGSEETSISIPSWSGTGSVYFDRVSDLMTLIKNSKRWIRYYPDKDNTDYWAGRAVMKVSRNLPVDDNLMATLTIEGSGEIYGKDS